MAQTATSGLRGLVTGKGGGTIAGTALGFVLYALGLNLIRGGPQAVIGWLGAKFINQPYLVSANPAKPSPSAKADRNAQ